MLCRSSILPLQAAKNIFIEVYLLKFETFLVNTWRRLFQVKSYISTEIKLYLGQTLASKTFTSMIKVSKKAKLYFNYSCKRTAKYTVVMWLSWLAHWLSLGPMNLAQWLKWIVYIFIYQLYLSHLVKFSVCVRVSFFYLSLFVCLYFNSNSRIFFSEILPRHIWIFGISLVVTNTKIFYRYCSH